MLLAHSTAVSALTLDIVDPAGMMMQDHLKRMEQAAPDDSPKPAAKIAAPQPSAPDSVAVVQILEIQFSKSELLAAADLQALGQRFVGRKLGTADIQQLLDEISRLYRDKGVLTGVPVLPQQDLQTGVMRILLVEGRLGEVIVGTPGQAQADWVQRWFDLEPNTVLTQEAVRERLVRFNNVSDYSATAEMVAGAQFGKTNLSVEVASADRVQAWGYFETSSADQATSPSQLSAGLRIAPLSAQGGRMDAAVLSTEAGSTLTGVIGFPLGVDGWRTSLSASAARSQSKISGSGVPDLQINGESAAFSWDLGRTWVLQDPWVLGTAISLSKQHSKTLVDDSPLFDRESDKVTLVGSLQYDSAAQRGNLRGSFTLGSDDNSYRYLELTGSWRSSMDAQGFWQLKTTGLVRFKPSGTLSSLDRFNLGGPDTVRGFDAGSASGDRGAAVQLELRRRMSDLAWESAEAYAFLDFGQATDPANEATQRLRSAGFGVQAKVHDHLGLEVMATRQLSTAQGSPTRVLLRLIFSY